MPDRLDAASHGFRDKTRRLSQRQPLACRACTKSKVRCDKQIPCARCSRRNSPCEREAVELSAKTLRKSFLRSKSSAQRSRAIERQDRPSYLPQLRTGSAVRTLYGDPGPDQPVSCLPSTKATLETESTQFKFEDLATCIEGLAWGRHQCHKYPHKDCLRFETHGNCSIQKSVAEDVIEKLPDVATARQLVQVHIRFLSWYHNVLHIPTFLSQCEKFWQSGFIEDGQWLATYCAVMSASAWSLQNSRTFDEQFGAMLTCPSPNVLLNIVGEILGSQDFMGRHTLHSLQAICISEMVANVVGKSDLLITWLSAGIRIAQCLGLHRIGQGALHATDAEVQQEMEIGRRVWWKLVEMDYHSVPYTGGTYSISLRHCSTEPPRNINDDFRPQSECALTSSTYALTQARIAILIPALLDGPTAGGDLASRYEHVITIDRQMRTLVAGISPQLLREPQSVTPGPEWLNLARRTLAIAAADKIIMIHRSFLLRSFESPAYLFTRQTCVSAARTILREHDEISKAGPDCPSIWIHSAFCVGAIVVICLELLHCHSTMSTERKDEYVQMIWDARQRLSISKHDTMAHRGVHLVDAMLNEQLYSTTDSDKTNRNDTRNQFDQILNRFAQLDRGEDPTSESTDPLSATSRKQLEDFDLWFDSLFR